MSKVSKLEIRNLGPIRSADLTFGDLTVLVGPQASGKSIALQTFKLAHDRGSIMPVVARYGLATPKDWPGFLELLYGEGMSTLWTENSLVKSDGVELKSQVPKKPSPSNSKAATVFYVPAQRAILLPDGFPRSFRDVDSSAPFVSREFSNSLFELLTEAEQNKALFPKAGKLTAEVRSALDSAVFHGSSIELKPSGRKKLEMFLRVGDASLPTIGWTAGQREFAPLLLSLYPLIPASKISKVDDVEWVVIEELEMGLHPQAIVSAMLLVFELIERGYRVVLSSHHPVVLDVVWGLRELQQLGKEGLSQDRSEAFFRKMIGLKTTPKGKKISAKALAAKVCVHAFAFDPKGGGSHSVDISSLDPGADDEATSGWGGLTQFSSDISSVLSEAVNAVVRG
jgi:AAA domain, putative AbiEii toxin, Type IV TA system